MKLATHIKQICEQHNILCISYPGASGRAWQKSRRIRISPVKTPITYAVALHELGHILGPHQTKERLWREIGAWIWAKQRAKEWPPSAQKTLETSLQSYIDWAWSKKNKGRNVYFPDVDDSFWEELLKLKS